jgi:hypothetical protein
VHLPVRRAAAGRRSPRVRRAPFWVSRTRLLAALLLVAVSGAFYWLTVAPQFALDDAKITVDGAHFTDAALIRSTIGLPDGATPNLFRIRTLEMRQALESLPPVLAAEVSANLPDGLRVVLHERSPIFVWQSGDSAWLADVNGLLFAPLSPGGDPAVAALPVVSDRRASRPGIQVGSRLDTLDLETARVLGALTPEQLGSAAHSLALSVDDAEGWVLTADTGWRAIFGYYTPVLHTTAEIPQQVQCLRSLLVDREPQIATITLAVGPDHCGTYLPLAVPEKTPAPAHSPAPGRSPAPTHPPGPGHSPAPGHSTAP